MRSTCTRLLALAGWLAVSSATGAGTVEQVLNGKNPLGSACHRADVGISASAVFAKAPVPVHTRSCGIDPQRAAEAARVSATVVDSRTAVDFAAFHIDGALNLTAAGIKTKSFLKHENLLLIGSGKAEEVLFDACERLKADGFANVHVIRGGLPAWLAHGLPVTGKAPSSTEMVSLSPSELLEEVSSARTRVLLTRAGGALKNEIPTAVAVVTDNLNGMVEAARAAVPPDGTVIFASSGSALDPQKIAYLVTELYPVPVLVYLDGRDAYKANLSTQKAIWTAHARGPKTLPCSAR